MAGAGKSSLGKVSKAFGFNFIDSDKLIETNKKSLQEILDEVEWKSLKKLKKQHYLLNLTRLS